MNYPCQMDSLCIPSEARRVREWAAEQYAAEDTRHLARQVAGELFVSMHAVTRQRVVLVVGDPVRGHSRISIYGVRQMPQSVTLSKSWELLRGLAYRASVTPDWCGLWAEIPVRGAAPAELGGDL